jgi:hypothetical protein
MLKLIVYKILLFRKKFVIGKYTYKKEVYKIALDANLLKFYNLRLI